jgi:peptide/nickel transport system permease protein
VAGLSTGIAARPAAGTHRRLARIYRVLSGNPKSLVGAALFLFFLLLAILGPFFAPYNPLSVAFGQSLPPSAQHWLGTTSQGQDILSQFLVGTRTTMVVGIGAGLLATCLSLLVGMTAGYEGGAVDSVLNFLSNIFLVLPGLALLILIESLVHDNSPVFNGLIIGLTGWGWGARVFRAQTLTLRQRDFVTAAKLTGASDLRIMVTEILPNMGPIVASNVMYACLAAILAESGLAFLGLENVAAVSWGTMLYWASQNDAILTGAWWWFIPPGLGIALTGLSLVLMNYAVDELANPRLAGARSSVKESLS